MVMDVLELQRSTAGRRRSWSRGQGAALFAGALLVVAACSESRRSNEAPAADASARATPPPAAAPDSRRPRIVVLGDSIAAGLGLRPQESFPSVLQQRLDAERLAFEVINAGVSGDTSAGGVRRLDWALDGDVRILVLELGANDGLRGLSVDEMSRNLDLIMERAKGRGVRVVLCGMEAPPNFGPEYTRAFRAAYVRLAREHGEVAFIPFVLDGVAGVPSLNQPDGIHPNAEGARRVADLVWTAVQPLLARTAAS
jgi:acyl-CoA thioesterase-1